MPTEPFTLMAVHAHPDDEATGTGGILALYAAQGVRTVLVTCTDGGCGDGPGGVKPGEPGHDPAEVARIRTGELRQSCEVLGIDVLEQLGYHDSGMMGWPQNDAPGAFWGMDVIQAAQPLIDLMRRYRPQVVVTYDANGFYGHPDHIMAHRIAQVATAASGIPVKLYYSAIPRSGLASFTEELIKAGVQPPGPSDREEGRYALDDQADAAGTSGAARTDDTPGTGEAEGPAFGHPDMLITTTIDVSAHVSQKRQALLAHASQTDNIFFLKLDDTLFDRFFGTETFIRAVDRTDAPVPESDLFAGVADDRALHVSG